MNMYGTITTLACVRRGDFSEMQVMGIACEVKKALLNHFTLEDQQFNERDVELDKQVAGFRLSRLCMGNQDNIIHCYHV